LLKSVYQLQRTHEFALRKLRKLFDIIQPYRSSAFMHFGPQNFSQNLSTPGTVYPENLTGSYTRKFLENRKNRQIYQNTDFGRFVNW